MPAAIASIPPRQLKEAYEAAGYKVIDEDEYTWVLALGAEDEPFVLPKKGRLVSVELMQAAFHRIDGTELRKFIMQKVTAFVAPR